MDVRNGWKRRLVLAKIGEWKEILSVPIDRGDEKGDLMLPNGCGFYADICIVRSHEVDDGHLIATGPVPDGDGVTAHTRVCTDN
jgi:hypothetical protein